MNNLCDNCLVKNCKVKNEQRDITVLICSKGIIRIELNSYQQTKLGV